MYGVKTGQWIVWDGHTWRVEKAPDSPRIAYDSFIPWTDTTYEANQLVLHNGQVYKAINEIAAPTGQAPNADATNWAVYIGADKLFNVITPWQELTAYKADALTTYKGNVYKALVDVPNTTQQRPSYDGNRWELFIGRTGGDGAGNNASVIDLSNPLGTFYNEVSYNTNTAFTIGDIERGGFATMFINAASEPTIATATKIKGADFKPNTLCN